MKHTVDGKGIAVLGSDPGIRIACHGYAEDMLRRVQRLAMAAYDTGATQRSYRIWSAPGRRIVIYVGSDFWRSGFVEWGMGALSAHHVLLRAAQKTGFKVRAVKYTH